MPECKLLTADQAGAAGHLLLPLGHVQSQLLQGVVHQSAGLPGGVEGRKVQILKNIIFISQGSGSTFQL